MKYMLITENFQLELIRESLERNLDSLVKIGNDVFLCIFHEQATHTHNCDTASRSGNPDYLSCFSAYSTEMH